MARTKEEKQKRRSDRKDRRAEKRETGVPVKKKIVSRTDRRKSKQDTTAKKRTARAGAIDRFSKGARTGRPTPDQGPVLQKERPDLVRPQAPQVKPEFQPAPQPAAVPIQPGQVFLAQQPAVAPAPQPAVAPAPQPQVLPPQPAAVDPAVVAQAQAIQQPGTPVAPTPAIAQVDPAMAAPPEQLQPEPGIPQPEQGAAFDQGDPLLQAPVSPEEENAQIQLEQAQSQGKQFSLTQPAMQPPETFYQDIKFGQPGGAAANPRDMERIRRKRLALMDPKVQQLRQVGRGLPQIRYAGGPAFQGAFQQKWGQPAQQPGQVRPQRQPIAR